MDSTEYYARLAPPYVPDDAFWRRDHQRRFDTFNGLVPAGRRRLLDFGCGTGENVVLLAGRGHDVVGIDPVPEMVERARAQLAAAGLPADRARVGDLGWLAGQPAGAFDAVTALNVLPYLTEDEEATSYREARRLTGPDGCVVVSHTNELVDLVTFNRYTVEFWRDRVIPELAEAPAESARSCSGSGRRTSRVRTCRRATPATGASATSRASGASTRSITRSGCAHGTAGAWRRLPSRTRTPCRPSSWRRAPATASGCSRSRIASARARCGTSSARSWCTGRCPMREARGNGRRC